ncbi:unnamed protein product [Camellia sinensis]
MSHRVFSLLRRRLLVSVSLTRLSLPLSSTISSPNWLSQKIILNLLNFAAFSDQIGRYGLGWVELSMYRIPRFFTHSEKQKSMDWKKNKKKSRPKLERRFANKNIDYEPSSSSSSSLASSPASEDSPAHRTRSLDLSPLGHVTSFRVQGNDGEFELICKSLGLSGPEDFAIPAAAWEARKLRLSSSDLHPISGFRNLESPRADPKVDDNDSGANELSNGFADRVRVNDESVDVCELSDKFGDSVRVCELSDKFGDSARVSEVMDNPITAKTSRSCGGGIKGVRPPVLAPPPSISLPRMDNVLAPPPSISLPRMDNSCSTWDILKSFAPDFNIDLSSAREYSSSDDDEEEIVEQKRLNGVMLGERRETAVHSKSSSFTTTNDDDCWSLTTEGMSNISPNDRLSNISPNDRFSHIVGDWVKGQLLGRGSFGSVYEGIADGGVFIAVKEVSLLDQGDQGRQSISQLEQEIALLSQFEHENIVRYYGTDKDESNLYIFLELVTKGSLLSLYQKYNLQDSIVSSYTRQILHGLKYLHERNVVHRDIKCANILVHANGSVKLADFGLAKATKLNDIKSCKGTPYWMAPEVVKRNDQGYGLPADIWSLGCTVLEMLTRQIPYANLESMQALFQIGRGVPPPVPDSLSRDARDFIFRCLQVKPNDRPTAADLLDHPYVRRPLPSSSGSSSPYNFGRRV